MTILTHILTYEPYQYVCDRCGYESRNSLLLSVIVRKMNKHRAEHHKQDNRRYNPAPIKVSEVGKVA